MSRPKPIFVDTSVISSNIFNYRDEEFYSIIGQLTGLEEAGFLKVQGIRTVNLFLRIENVFDVLTIDSEEINNIKKDICFMLDDNTYIIKPGIKASFEYLRDLFLRKQKEVCKNINHDNSNVSDTPSPMIPTPEITPNESTTTTMTTTTTTTTTIASIHVVDHRSSIIQAIDEWCLRHGNELNIPGLKLIEGCDYFLSLPSYGSDFVHIRCACRASAKLSRQGSHFQLSNYYRHLKTRKCSTLKSKSQTIPVSSDVQVTIDHSEGLSSKPHTIIERNQTSSSTVRSFVHSKRMSSSSDCQAKRKKQKY